MAPKSDPPDSAPLADAPTAEMFACQPELLDLFEELVNVIFCAKSSEGVYVAVNQAFVRRTGRRSRRDVLHRRASDLFAEPLAERYEAQDEQVIRSGEPLRDELELIRRVDGSLGWYLTTKLPVPSADGEATVGLVSISRDLATPSDDRVVIESLQEVVRHVQNHLGDPLRVAELASVAACSPSSLERRMKRVFGLTVTQFVLRARVERAAELLTSTDQPLSEVAAAVGFYDQADLTRRFARLIGETPGQFRKKQT